MYVVPMDNDINGGSLVASGRKQRLTDKWKVENAKAVD